MESSFSGNSYKKIFSLISVTILIISTFFLKSPYLGIVAAFFALLCFDRPIYLFPPLLISTLLNESCFIWGNVTGSRVFSIMLIVAIIFSRGVKKFNRNIFIYVSLLMIYVLFSSLFSYSGLTTSTYTMLLNLILVLFMSKLFFTTDEIYDVFTVMFIACILFVASMFAKYFQGVDVFANGAYALLTGINNNSIGISLEQIGCVILAEYIIHKSVGIKKIIAIVALISDIALIFLSGSRSALIALLGATFIYSIIMMKEQKYRLRIIILYCMAVLVGGIVLGYLMENNAILSQRFTMNDIMETGGSGRVGIWEIVWNNIVLKYPLFGVGFGGQNVIHVLSLNGNIHSGAHNILFAMLAEMGFVGTTILIVGLIWLVKKLNDIRKYNINAILPLLMLMALLINGIGENIYDSRIMWLVIGLSVSVIFNATPQNFGGVQQS